jgi:hypothetical protein
MKHLLTGVAMAAAFAIAAPVWAQTTPAPMTPSSPAPAPSTSTPTPKKPMHHPTMRHHARGYRGEGDQTTEQLNQQELQRIMGGGGMPATPTPAPGMSAPPPPPK